MAVTILGERITEVRHAKVRKHGRNHKTTWKVVYDERPKLICSGSVERLLFLDRNLCRYESSILDPVKALEELKLFPSEVFRSGYLLADGTEVWR